jgi:hypothetical protein
VPRPSTVLLALALCACLSGAEPAPVRSVHLQPTAFGIAAGDTFRFEAVGVNDSVPRWTSSDTAVATVDQTGLARARNPGVAVITVAVGQSFATATLTVTPAVLVGAGDIGACGQTGPAATAALIDAIPGIVFTAGDDAYPNGSTANFAQCYDPSWGRHKARTRPSPGNHDYVTPGGAAYYAYFGRNAGPAGLGYYSYTVGTWHVISLNSQVSTAPGSPQDQWLRADLGAHRAQCTLAYWHYPRFSQGPHGSITAVAPLWQALADSGADVVIVGHDHNYQRFAPQTPTGVLDNASGIREFVVGTGGASHYDFPNSVANLEVKDSVTFGVLQLTLHATSYDWVFLPVAGGTFTDSGTGNCH